MNASKKLLVGATAALLAGAAFAAGTTFNTLDVNGDAQISKTEATADEQLVLNFKKFDNNSNGYIDSVEFLSEGKSSLKQESIPSSQSPESASPNSPGTSSKTDPNMQQGRQPSGNRERSADTEQPGK